MAMHGFVCALGLQTNRSDSMIFYLLDLGQQRETRLPSVSARRPPASPCIVQQSGSHRLATFRQPAWCNIPSASLWRMLRFRVETQALRRSATERPFESRAQNGGHPARSRQRHPDSFSKRRQAWPSGLLEGSACVWPVLSCCDRGSWELPDVKRLFCLHD